MAQMFMMTGDPAALSSFDEKTFSGERPDIENHRLDLGKDCIRLFNAS
jgi:hypothetical protein